MTDTPERAERERIARLLFNANTEDIRGHEAQWASIAECTQAAWLREADAVLAEIARVTAERDVLRAEVSSWPKTANLCRELDAVKSERDRAYGRLREIARVGDTLSPQELCNHAALGQGLPMPEYLGDPTIRHKSVIELNGRLRDAVRKLASIAEREAACCPEDVPFDEYIRALTAELADLRAKLHDREQLLKAAREASAMPGHPDGEHKGFTGDHRMAATLGLVTMARAGVVELKHDDAHVYLAQFLANHEQRGAERMREACGQAVYDCENAGHTNTIYRGEAVAAIRALPAGPQP